MINRRHHKKQWRSSICPGEPDRREARKESALSFKAFKKPTNLWEVKNLDSSMISIIDKWGWIWAPQWF
jgi:hypothetical protein